jgi:hypothetical protein
VAGEEGRLHRKPSPSAVFSGRKKLLGFAKFGTIENCRKRKAIEKATMPFPFSVLGLT